MIKLLRFRCSFSVLLFTFLLNGFDSFGQDMHLDPFIGDMESGFNQSQCEVLSVANLEQYRLRSSRQSFKFESGVSFELLSAFELAEAGYLVAPGNYITQNHLNPLVQMVFKLGLEGQLAVRSEIDSNSKLSAMKVLPASISQNKVSASDLYQMSEEKCAFVPINPGLF
jgi:hypothetical protein